MNVRTSKNDKFPGMIQLCLTKSLSESLNLMTLKIVGLNFIHILRVLCKCFILFLH